MGCVHLVRKKTMPRRNPATILRLNYVGMSGIITKDPTFFPHAEDPRFDNCHFVIGHYETAINRKTGKKTSIQHYPCNCFGKLARYVNENLQKMDAIVVFGKLRQSNPDQTYQRPELVLNEIQLLRNPENDPIEIVHETEWDLEDLPENAYVII